MTPSSEQPWLLPPIVVKVGGSLYDWPEFGPRLRQFLATYPERHLVLVPGGGPFADQIRAADRIHQLGMDSAHWLALHSLTLSGRLLAALVPGARVIEGLTAARPTWSRSSVTVIDLARFARGDETRAERLPHTWDATSDSFSARVARVAGAERLILLKSADPPPDWQTTGGNGFVDPLFAATVAGAPFLVEAINLRRWQG